MDTKAANSPLEQLGAAPILKWVGGKRVILEILRANIKNTKSPLVEPFIGGGALSFSVPTSGPIFIGDLNPELVNLYKVVSRKSDAESLIALLQTREFKITQDNYYAIRSWDRENNLLELDPIRVAARTYFLNRTGFNGLYRVNSTGYFNVPFGQKQEDMAFDFENIRSLQKLLASKLNHENKKRFKIHDAANYREQVKSVLSEIPTAVTVYLDPPYASAPPNNDKAHKPQSFKTYQKGGFSDADQQVLADFVQKLPQKHQVLVSNVATDQVKSWYSGMYFLTIPSVPRRVSGKTSGRTGVDEILISNRPLEFELNGVSLESGKLR